MVFYHFQNAIFVKMGFGAPKSHMLTVLGVKSGCNRFLTQKYEFDLLTPMTTHWFQWGTLGLNNFNSSPEGSTKIGRLIVIGHSYLCIKF